MKLLFLSLLVSLKLTFPLSAKTVISFFNEMKSPQLMQFFRDSTIIPDLQQLNARIRMGTLDILVTFSRFH